MVQEKDRVARSHTFSEPLRMRVTNGRFHWRVDFKTRQIEGSADWEVQRGLGGGNPPLILDTRGLTINSVLAGTGESLRLLPELKADQHQEGPQKAAWMLGPKDKILGQPLLIQLDPKDQRVCVRYTTGPESAGLQWLAPSQTAGKKKPYLFTQAEPILCRTFLPCQDTPQVRFTYEAIIDVPQGLNAVAAARRDWQRPETQGTRFHYTMPEPIPSYLVAFAVGNIDFLKLGPRTGVYAEPEVVKQAAWEFADAEKMVSAVEQAFGTYRWGRFDILVLPPSFPFGGMENPRLTFATPTVLAHDRSLVSLVAHELAHSWSGNLVTNASWSDLWLNEGFTVYLERRILEILYGKKRADMEAVLGYQDLLENLKELKPEDTLLHIDLRGRDPDDVFSDVPYEKGFLFLRTLEQHFGRPRFDRVLKEWFNSNAFRSRSSADFEAFIQDRLFDGYPERAQELKIKEWIYGSGLPDNAALPTSSLLEAVHQVASRFLSGEITAMTLPAGKWSTQEWVAFLRLLPANLKQERMAALDQRWKLSQSHNSEILMRWLLDAVRAHFEPAFPALKHFLTSQGRRKFLRPLYKALAATPKGLKKATAIYREARPLYHAISRRTLDEILHWGSSAKPGS